MKRNSEAIILSIVSVAAGTLMGAGIALLLAPMRGKDLRKKIADTSDDALNKIRQTTIYAQDKAKDVASRLSSLSHTQNPPDSP